MLTIDGFGPLPISRPADPKEFGEFVREMVEAGRGIYPLGGGTALGYGRVPTKPGTVADTRNLAAVIDYPARDMTVTVQAGIAVAELQRILAKEGQRLPVDIPNPDRATLGGAIATNASGPRRLANGTLRDYLIGISFLTDAGTEVKAGGRVVKNVAGYDLMKLHVGALGTLGIVTQVTLKVFPKPEDSAILAFGVAASAVGPALDRLHGSASRPVAVEVLNSVAAKRVGVKLPTDDAWVIAVGFEEKATTVTAQLAALKDELKAAPARDLVEFRGPECEVAWAGLLGLQVSDGPRFAFRATLLPSRVAPFLAAATEAHPGLAIHGHAGNGVVFASIPSAETTAEKAAGIVARLTPLTGDSNGNVEVLDCPSEWKATVPFWGRPPRDLALMRTVKQTLDPGDLFNPGRLFG